VHEPARCRQRDLKTTGKLPPTTRRRECAASFCAGAAYKLDLKACAAILQRNHRSWRTMNPTYSTPFSKQRLEALSDGVFAVVMTLLVLDLKVERLPAHASNADVLHALRELRLPVFAYGLSFLLASLFWVQQHVKFAMMDRVDGPHLAASLAFLLGVTLLPFSVSVYYQGIGNGIGPAIYFANQALIAGTLALSWHRARRCNLVSSKVPIANQRRFSHRLTALALGFAAGAAAGLIKPIYAGVAFSIVVLPILLWSKRQVRTAT
jgi:uncharacterized membrane protein